MDYRKYFLKNILASSKKIPRLETTRIKMSLVSFTFNTVKMQVVTVDGKEWVKAKEIYTALKYKKDTSDVIRGHCGAENITHRYQLSGSPTAEEPVNWLKDSQKYDLYTSEGGLYELLFSSQQPLAKAFREHCCNESCFSIVGKS